MLKFTYYSQMIRFNQFQRSIRLGAFLFVPRSYINTEIIKQYQKELEKTNPSRLNKYPQTFEEKMMVVNHPKTIHYLQVVEFGVKYKPGKRWLPILLALFGLVAYVLTKTIPIRVTDRYLTISPQSPDYFSGYFFSILNYEKPFYLYLPLLLGVYQLSRFISTGQFAAMVLVNCIIGNVLGQYLVNQRVSKYEIWENQRISFGEANILGLMYAFWAYIGFTDAFGHLKSRIFLKTLKGKGIVRSGLPFGYLCVVYSLLEFFFYAKGSKNSELVLAEVCAGIAMGLILRRVKPMLK